MTGVSSGGRSASGQSWRTGERKRDPSSSPGIELYPRGKNRFMPILSKESKERCRNLDWTVPETTVLINCKKEGGRFRKGKIMNWVATGGEIKNVTGSTRTKKECQRRSDTLVKAYKELKRHCGACGVNHKQFFESTENERSVKLSTRLTQAWYEDLEEIEQQQPGHLSSSKSGGSASLSGTQTPSRSALAEDAGNSDTDLISSLQSSPSPDRTQFQEDPAVPIQAQSSESTDLVFQQRAQGPATPGVLQEEDPNLQDGEDSGALSLTLESIDKSLQESQDCHYFFTYGWIAPWELDK